MSFFLIILVPLTAAFFCTYKLIAQKNKLIRKLEQRLEQVEMEKINQRIRLTYILGRKDLILERFQALSSALSHDLKSPANTIKSFTGILELRTKQKLDDDEIKMLDFIFDSSKNLIKLTDITYNFCNTTLALFKAYNNVSIAEVCNSIYIEQANYFKKTKISFIVGENISPVFGQKEMLVKLFVYLILNSIDFLERKSNLELKVYSQPKDEGVLVSIEDNSTGMSEELIREVMEETTFNLKIGVNQDKNNYKLNICKEIIYIHNGKFSIESEISKGITYKIYIPNEKYQR